MTSQPQIFDTGSNVISNGVRALFGSVEVAHQVIMPLVDRHGAGDFGNTPDGLVEINNLVIPELGQVHSRYEIEVRGEKHVIGLTTDPGHNTTRWHLMNEQAITKAG